MKMRCFGSKIPSKTSKKTTNSTIKSRFNLGNLVRSLKALKRMISFAISCAGLAVTVRGVEIIRRVNNWEEI